MRIEYFQLIDHIVDLDLAERKITCAATIPTDSTIFEGHFPGYPLMPGVLLIESMAQTSGWLVVAANNFQRMPFLAAVKDAKLRTFIKPGQSLMVSAELKHEGSGYAMSQAIIMTGGKTACEATLTFSVVAFPNAVMGEQMRARAGEIGYPMGAPADG
jgi:3-hydroxyacyl-[acyl-carrier-protein] dehydratase